MTVDEVIKIAASDLAWFDATDRTIDNAQTQLWKSMQNYCNHSTSRKDIQKNQKQYAERVLSIANRYPQN